MRDHRSTHQVHAAHVHPHHPVEQLGLRLHNVADAGDTCVVEENVDPAEAPDNALGERNGLCLVGHVDLLGNRIRAADSDLLHGLDGCIEVDVGGDHAGALLRETAGAGLADPGARTGDQADLVLESVAHLWP